MSGRGPRGRARTRSDVAQSAVTGMAEAAETGRGRGIPPSAQEAEPLVPGRSPTGSGSPTGSSNDNGSGKSSPPQAQPVSVGRAAIRGKSGQPTGMIETGLIEPLERLSLLATGEAGEERQPARRQIEFVPVTKPESCKDKRGKRFK